MLVILKVLAPGTVAFFILVAGASVVLTCWPGGRRRTGVAAAVLLAASYAALSLPWVAGSISSGLIQFGALRDEQEGRDASAVVVLDGDSQHARVVETLRLYRLLQPRSVIVLGPELMRDELIAAGIPAQRITHDWSAQTTREQVMILQRLGQGQKPSTLVLVASAIHMARAVAAARAAGLDVVPSASATRRLARQSPFRPEYNALRLSRESIYEYVALAYYRWRGWL